MGQSQFAHKQRTIKYGLQETGIPCTMCVCIQHRTPEYDKKDGGTTLDKFES